MGLKRKNFNITEGSLKNPIFRRGTEEGGFPKNQYIGGNRLKGKGGTWTVSRFEWGGTILRFFSNFSQLLLKTFLIKIS